MPHRIPRWRHPARRAAIRDSVGHPIRRRRRHWRAPDPVRGRCGTRPDPGRGRCDHRVCGPDGGGDGEWARDGVGNGDDARRPEQPDRGTPGRGGPAPDSGAIAPGNGIAGAVRPLGIGGSDGGDRSEEPGRRCIAGGGGSPAVAGELAGGLDRGPGDSAVVPRRPHRHVARGVSRTI